MERLLWSKNIFVFCRICVSGWAGWWLPGKKTKRSFFYKRIFRADSYLFPFEFTLSVYQWRGSGMVEPGSWFLSIQDPGSNNSNIRGGGKNLLSRLFCSHEFFWIENYFSFEQVLKKFEPVGKEVNYFSLKKVPQNSRKYMLAIQNSRSDIQ